MAVGQATKLEVLLAVAMSELHQTTHVIFMPVGKEFTRMLTHLRAAKLIEPKTENYYTVTEKGYRYIKKKQVTKFRALDAEIDKFVDALP